MDSLVGLLEVPRVADHGAGGAQPATEHGDFPVRLPPDLLPDPLIMRFGVVGVGEWPGLFSPLGCQRLLANYSLAFQGLRKPTSLIQQLGPQQAGSRAIRRFRKSFRFNWLLWPGVFLTGLPGSPSVGRNPQGRVGLTLGL